MARKFLRQDLNRYFKLGKLRRKYRVWRKPKGRHSKMRQKRRGYPESPTVGHASPKKEAGKIKGMIPVLIHNVKELEKLDKKSLVIIAKVGARKKLDIIKKANSLGFKILNVKENKK